MFRLARRRLQSMFPPTAPTTADLRDHGDAVPHHDGTARREELSELRLKVDTLERRLADVTERFVSHENGGCQYIGTPHNESGPTMGGAPAAETVNVAGLPRSPSQPRTEVLSVEGVKRPETAPVLSDAEFNDLYHFKALQRRAHKPFGQLRRLATPEDLVAFGQFLSHELPIQLAIAAKELGHGPFGLLDTMAIRQLRYKHEQSFVDIKTVPPPNAPGDMEPFCNALQEVFARHNDTTGLVSEGLQELLSRTHGHTIGATRPEFYQGFEDIQVHLDSFFAGRVRIRFILGHFIASAHRIMGVGRGRQLSTELNTYEHSEEHFTGLVCEAMNMRVMVEAAVREARALLSTTHFNPEVHVEVHGDPDFTFRYVPSQSFNILTSLIVHAMKVTTRGYVTRGRPLAPVRVVVSQRAGQEDVVVEVRDEAGGVPLHMVDAARTYLYSAVSKSEALRDKETPDAWWMKSALRIPYAAVAARQFGGDVALSSVSGFGSTATYWAPVLPERVIDQWEF